MNSNYKPKVSAYTLGCKVNQYETVAMLQILEEDGFEIVGREQLADIFLINTCTVTNTADKKSRNAISHASRLNKEGRIIVCGCMAQSYAEELLKLPNVYAVIGTDKRLYVAEAAKACLENKKVKYITEKNADFERLKINNTGGRTRAHIKVQEGCSNYCTYCIIPHMRGKPRSRDLKDAVTEAETLVRAGVKELVITGINLSSYCDRNNNRFTNLICTLGEMLPHTRLRLGSLDVYNLEEDDLIRLSAIKNLCPHFHISLQSGSDSVLDRMRRKYNTHQFLNYIEMIRKYWDNPAITTDVITGFPGETEAEFVETENFIKKAGFSRLHVFPYSERKGTEAAQMANSIAKKIRKQRAARLIEIGRVSEQKYIDILIGKSATILFEEKTENGVRGYIERYVNAVCKEGEPGEIYKVRLVKREGNNVYAEIIK